MSQAKYLFDTGKVVTSGISTMARALVTVSILLIGMVVIAHGMSAVLCFWLHLALLLPLRRSTLHGLNPAASISFPLLSTYNSWRHHACGLVGPCQSHDNHSHHGCCACDGPCEALQDKYLTDWPDICQARHRKWQ